jgi:ketosteroid isomerase-like protein
MYKTIVAREVRSVWTALDTGDYEPVLSGFARQFRYENIAADHALGGTFTTREEMAQHFALMFRVFGDLRFTVRDILVSGWPGNTSVIVDVGIAATLADGTPYENELVQQMTLRWGKVTEVRALIDNVRARAALDRLAGTGVLDPAAVAVG